MALPGLKPSIPKPPKTSYILTPEPAVGYKAASPEPIYRHPPPPPASPYKAPSLPTYHDTPSSNQASSYQPTPLPSYHHQPTEGYDNPRSNCRTEHIHEEVSKYLLYRKEEKYSNCLTYLVLLVHCFPYVSVASTYCYQSFDSFLVQDSYIIFTWCA